MMIMSRCASFLLGMAFLSSIPLIAQAKVGAYYEGGAVIIGETSLDCDPNIAGAIRWNDANSVHDVCVDGEWLALDIQASTAGDAATQPIGVGYFVLSYQKWTGALGGRSGANQKCLDDLTDNDWMGKADAVSRGLLSADKVRVFLCTASGYAACNHMLPGVSYVFAASGFPTHGGAVFGTDSSRLGPGDNENWAGINYFGLDARYWTNRSTTSTTQWASGGQLSAAAATCSSFTSESGTARPGWSNATTSARWNSVPDLECSVTANLICVVHP